MMFSVREGVFLLVWMFSMYEAIKGAQIGKVDIQQVGNDDFYCDYVSFSNSFSSGTPVRVFASLNHGNESSGVHDTAFIWVEDVTTSGFKACLVQGGQGNGGNTTIDWFAFQGPQSGVHHGEASFSLFTTGSKCKRVSFPQTFSLSPKLHVTVKHGTPNQKHDAMSVWIANVSTSQFEVCLQESRTFDGSHSNIMVNWMAYEMYPSAWKAKESSKIVFSKNELPTAENNYALCKNVSFASPFYTAPVVLTTVLNGGSNNANIACPVEGPLNGWLEEVTNTHFRVCIKDNAGYDGQRSNVIVDYLVIGDLDPCTNASCKYHSHCVALSPHQFTCVCEDSCPSYEEQVCASNGRTFKNLCLLRQEICRTNGNYTDYHPGSCTGFPLQKGRHTFQNVPSWAEDQCEVIRFEPFIFYPHQKIYIQLTVNHINYSDSAFVHEATTPWVESVNSTQFTACVTRAGRNDYPSDSFATIDWVAYQGSPSGGVAGEEMFSRWWTGTSCQTVTFPKGKYSSSPTIFATAEHRRSRLKHDATSVWLEDVSASSFKICLRELQNFAGVHNDISVSWLAFESLHRPLFSEHNDVSFQNNALPPERNNFAFCQDVSFFRNYSKSPTVLLTAKHSTSGGNAAAECNGIVSWIEFVTNSGFRICVKELFVKRFDPLNVSYAVLSDICQDGWSYFNGYCYRKVSFCDSWSSSQRTCAKLGANLPSVHSQEENVYIQSLHGGEHSWLGLSDISTEGTFVWSDGTPFDFHYWAKHQPNNFHNEDCVHTLGFLQNHKYEWNDVNCTDCHRFTCKKDIDECAAPVDPCEAIAYSTCKNTNGSYTCQCNEGFVKNGSLCGVGAVITQKPSSVTVEVGENVSLVCQASGQPTPTVTWRKAFSHLPKGKTTVVNGTLTIRNITKVDGGAYACRATNLLGEDSAVAQVTVTDELKFNLTPPVRVVAPLYSNVILHCTAQGSLNISWKRAGQNLPQNHVVYPNGTLLLQNVSTSDAGNYSCVAKNSQRSIEATSVLEVFDTLMSCSSVKSARGGSSSGNYLIDPDGKGGVTPFSVYCDMSDKSGVGVTVISHDSESRTHVGPSLCEPAGCYSKDVRYTGVSTAQLAALTRVSQNCEQFIKFECNNDVLFIERNYAWWVSRDGTRMNYWGGATGHHDMCACGVTNSCSNGNKCNCYNDRSDSGWREDSGLLTDKSALPVTQIRLGDIGDPQEEGYHTLGKLKCYGLA
ncbi:hypothetical protein ACROYT_G032545 [Oculina patagonica]